MNKNWEVRLLLPLVCFVASGMSMAQLPGIRRASTPEYYPVWVPGPGSNAGTPIIKVSDPTTVTDRIHSRDVTLGLNALGGGYVSYCAVGKGANMVRADYGKGWQSAIRDMLHGGRYNPTQAGFRDSAGAPVSVVVTPGRAVIPKFNVALYSDPIYNFTAEEDLAPKYPRFHKKDGDETGIKKEGGTQDEEVRSEFDYSGVYEDVSARTYRNIPAFRHCFYYAYARPPKAILQFGSSARLESGKALFNVARKVKDVSPVLPGDQTPSDTDLSMVLMGDFGIRLQNSVAPYKIPMWVSKGRWVVSDEPVAHVVGVDPKLSQRFMFCDGKPVSHELERNSDFAFGVMADGRNALTARAIGMYFPQHGMNEKPVVGINRKGEILYRDDRRVRLVLSFENMEGPKQVVIRPLLWTSGLFAPNRFKDDCIEALYQEVYILFGTPDEIFRSVQMMEKSYTR